VKRQAEYSEAYTDRDDGTVPAETKPKQKAVCCA
jgi:hypothetical protein